jgi:hypothetical protein
MEKIIKTKFLCKTGCKTTRKYGILLAAKGIEPKWTDLFIEGKWYDGEYETWSQQRYKLNNNSWKRYWVVNENGVKEEIDRIKMSTIFQLDIEELRDNKINEILK